MIDLLNFTSPELNTKNNITLLPIQSKLLRSYIAIDAKAGVNTHTQPNRTTTLKKNTKQLYFAPIMIAVICLKTLLNIIIIIIITIYYSLRKIQLCFFLFDMTLPHSNIVYVV